MATKRSKIAQQESEFYGGAVKEAWGDLYGEADYGGGDFFKGFPIKDLAKWGIPYLLLKNWGEKETDKKTNAALARANSGLLEIQQQKALRENDIDRMSISGGREALMRNKGIGNVEDTYNIMHQIMGEISPDALATFKATYEAQAAINKDAATGTTYTDPLTALGDLQAQIKKEAIRKYNEHNLISKQYHKARLEGFMPYEDIINPDTGDILLEGKAYGYMDKVNAAEKFMNKYITKIELDAQSLNWVDGILLKFGIKKLDRSVISKKVTQEAIKNKTAEVIDKFSFEFPYSELDEGLRLEVQNRVASDMFSYEAEDANGKKIMTAIPITEITPAILASITETTNDPQKIEEVVEKIAIEAINDVTGISDVNAITKSIDSDKFQIREGRERKNKILVAHTALLNANDILITDQSKTSRDSFNTALDTLYQLELQNLKAGFGPDFYQSFATEFGDTGTVINANAELEFMKMWDSLLQAGNLAPYQIIQLQSLKHMIFSKNKLFGDSSLPDSQKESGYNPYTSTNERFVTSALLNAANRVTLIAKGQIADFVLNTRPDLESQWDAVNKAPIAGSELADIMRIVDGKKGPYIAMAKLISDPTGKKSSEELTYATLLEGQIRDVSKLYIMDGYLMGDATLAATLDVLAVARLIGDTGWRSDKGIATLHQSANVIKGKGFERDGQGQLPLWSRLVNPEDLADLQNGTINGVTLQKRYEEMALELDNKTIDEIVVLGDRYREFITGTGEYDPNDVAYVKGLRPFNDINSIDQVKILAEMATSLMQIDGTLQRRIKPFYDAIMRSALPTGRAELYGYTIGASDEVANLNGLLLQEFNLAGLLHDSEAYKGRIIPEKEDVDDVDVVTEPTAIEKVNTKIDKIETQLDNVDGYVDKFFPDVNRGKKRRLIRRRKRELNNRLEETKDELMILKRYIE